MGVTHRNRKRNNNSNINNTKAIVVATSPITHNNKSGEIINSIATDKTTIKNRMGKNWVEVEFEYIQIQIDLIGFKRFDCLK